MSITTLFTRKAPTIGGIEFDAVLEDTLDVSVILPEYTIESGAVATDHRIITPFKWSMVGIVSNTPLGIALTDFTGLLNIGGGVLATVAGLSAGFLSGSSDTRGSSALDFLITLMVSGEPFDVDAGDIQLTNMVIGRIRRTKTAANEGGLVFEADLQELPTLDTIVSNDQPGQAQLRDGDVAQSQAAAVVDKGEQGLQPVPVATQAAVSGVII